MKKTIRLISSLVLALVLVCGTTAISFAADATSHVTYKGKAEQFIFQPGSKYSPTDLFTDFKGVMPGRYTHAADRREKRRFEEM